MEVSIRGILQAHYGLYASTHGVPRYIDRAARQLSRCRTAALGAHFAECPQGHERHIVYHSCRHRLCPRCAALPRERWLEEMRARLISCPHWHVVFTLPHDLHPLWRYNREWFTQALFEAVSSTLRRLCADEGHLGAVPGYVLALHTWGRSLSLHPHIHALITDGGMDAGGEWRKPRRSCFLPARVVMALFRGRICGRLGEALSGGELKIPEGSSRERTRSLLNRLGRQKWNVHLCERYDHGSGVMTYLGRYVRGGVLKDTQLQATGEQEIRFSYRAHVEGGTRREVLRLEPGQFLSRYLEHTPLPRRATVRHYGLYANRNGAVLDAARREHGQEPLSARERRVLSAEAYYIARVGGPSRATHCSVCGAALRAVPAYEVRAPP